MHLPRTHRSWRSVSSFRSDLLLADRRATYGASSWLRTALWDYSGQKRNMVPMIADPDDDIFLLWWQSAFVVIVVIIDHQPRLIIVRCDHLGDFQFWCIMTFFYFSTMLLNFHRHCYDSKQISVSSLSITIQWWYWSWSLSMMVMILIDDDNENIDKMYVTCGPHDVNSALRSTRRV